ncbi:MAG: hypothetical protein ABEK50_12050, partial [bacterium]
IKQISDFLTQLREVKDDLTELILEVGPEKTPELASSMLDTTDFAAEGEEAIIESVEFARELYSFDESRYPSFVSEGPYRHVHKLLEEVIFFGRWSEQPVLDLVESLSELKRELP